jgi:hypothetical protein
LVRLAEGNAPQDRLLVGPKDGVLTTAIVRDATNWDPIVAGLGLPDLTRHGLRHTGATWMAAGVPLHVLQEILGHASMETTRGYVHPDDRHLASAAEQANAFLFPSGQKRQASDALSDAYGSTGSSSGPLLVPLSTGRASQRILLSIAQLRQKVEGDRKGTRKNRLRKQQNPDENSFSSEFFCRADRI